MRAGFSELRRSACGAGSAGSAGGCERVDEILATGRVTCRELYEYMSDSRSLWAGVPKHEVMRGLRFCKSAGRERESGYSPEFRRELERLRAQVAESEYQDMVKHGRLNMAGPENGGDDEGELSPSQMNKQIKEEVTTVFNIIISVVSVVVAVWFWSRNSHILSPHHRVLLCLFFAILVLVAEVVVYSSYLRKIGEARRSERTKKERKRVVKKIVIN